VTGFALISFLEEHFDAYASGFWVTVRLVAVSFAIAMAVGTFMAALRVAPVVWLQRLGAVYVETFRNVPLLVLLFISFAGLRRAGVDINAWVAGTASLGLYTGAYVVEALPRACSRSARGRSRRRCRSGSRTGRPCGTWCCRRPSGR